MMAGSRTRSRIAFLRHRLDETDQWLRHNKLLLPLMNLEQRKAYAVELDIRLKAHEEMGKEIDDLVRAHENAVHEVTVGALIFVTLLALFLLVLALA
jgi:hypothetical protein